MHIVYQSLVEGNSLIDGKRWWGGRAHLEYREYFDTWPSESEVFCIFPTGDDAWDAPLKEYNPQHAKGMIGVEFYSLETAHPQPVHLSLDRNLGRITRIPWNSHVYEDFASISNHYSEVISLRKTVLCKECATGIEKRCSCTLRKRYLDRWICIPCVLAEMDARGKWRFAQEVSDYECDRALCPCDTETTYIYRSGLSVPS